MGDRGTPHPTAATPRRSLYGVQTELALANFDVGGRRLCDHPELLRAIVAVKIAAARANAALGGLDAARAEAIVAAGEEVLAGRHHDAFPVPIVQGGGGTSTHMNVNEVLAALASRILAERDGAREVHPNDHVNRGQSTNDVMPTAIALAVREIADATRVAVTRAVDALQAKAAEYPELEHLGRTCLQDAVPVPVAEVHRAQAHGIALGRDAIERTVDALLAVPLGATAVGTGIGTSDGFAERALAELVGLTGRPLVAAPNPYYALASLEPLVAVAEAVDRCARSLARVGADLRLLASGPTGGIGEVELPRVQAGSSIMPGKVNPVIPELLMQVSFQCAGEAASARSAAAVGELEVSAMAPVVSLGLLAGLARLARAATIFAERCVAELSWNVATVEANLAGSLTPAVLASVSDGYDHAARGHVRPRRRDERGARS